MKIETEEIFVLIKAKVGGTKIEKAEQAAVDQKERLDKKSRRNEPRKQRFNVVAWRERRNSTSVWTTTAIPEAFVAK